MHFGLFTSHSPATFSRSAPTTLYPQLSSVCISSNPSLYKIKTDPTSRRPCAPLAGVSAVDRLVAQKVILLRGKHLDRLLVGTKVNGR